MCDLWRTQQVKGRSISSSLGFYTLSPATPQGRIKRREEDGGTGVQSDWFPWATSLLGDPAVEIPGFQLQGLAEGLTYNVMEKAVGFLCVCVCETGCHIVRGSFNLYVTEAALEFLIPLPLPPE